MKISVQGEMQAIAWSDGSSGRLTGDLAGFYEGYRTGTPRVQSGEITVAHGVIAYELVHDLDYPLPPRPAQNPFARATFEELLRTGPLAAPAGEKPAPFRGSRATPITLRIDPAKSRGVFSGATGELSVTAPHHKQAGHMVVARDGGDLVLTFLEWSVDGRLLADLRVDGARSSGVYRDATGDLHFELDLYLGGTSGMGIGAYSGALELSSRAADEHGGPR
jgi:hypothetical protein